jgi:hypothetical protein
LRLELLDPDGKVGKLPLQPIEATLNVGPILRES